ncbi:TPA: HNH endonuclease [Bacillus toyonensis]
MRKLQKPTDLPLDVLLTCISNYENKDLTKRIKSIGHKIVEDSEVFEQKVKSKELHTLEPYDGILGIVTTQEMKNVYNDKLVKKGQPGRDIYDRILNAPKLKKCPLCGIRVVSTLDHHLPKAKYPALAVTPINLIPSCFDCNKTKTSTRPLTAEEETLHPYFDNVEDDLWLKAEVIHQFPVGFKFSVEQPYNWDDLKYKRVKKHFKTYELGPLYSIFAAEEYSIRDLTLNRIFDKSGSKELRLQLEDYAESAEKVHLNSWQSAMYRALEKSEWYIQEYFLSDQHKKYIE